MTQQGNGTKVWQRNDTSAEILAFTGPTKADWRIRPSLLQLAISGLNGEAQQHINHKETKIIKSSEAVMIHFFQN